MGLCCTPGACDASAITEAQCDAVSYDSYWIDDGDVTLTCDVNSNLCTGNGACCFEGAGGGFDCLDNLDETDCGIFEGQYAGEGILCEHINCPVYHPVVYGPGAVSSLWCTIEGPGPGMPVPRQLPNTYTNVKLPGGECIWMECVYPNCPYPNCKK